MPNVSHGVLVKCDPAMKQFLLHLDETNALGRKFVIHNLDDSHLLVEDYIVEELQTKLDELMDKISIPMDE